MSEGLRRAVGKLLKDKESFIGGFEIQRDVVSFLQERGFSILEHQAIADIRGETYYKFQDDCEFLEKWIGNKLTEDVAKHNLQVEDKLLKRVRNKGSIRH